LVFHDPQAEPLDLIAENEQDFFAWTIGLTHLVSSFNFSLTKMKAGTLMTKVRLSLPSKNLFNLEFIFVSWKGRN